MIKAFSRYGLLRLGLVLVFLATSLPAACAKESGQAKEQAAAWSPAIASELPAKVSTIELTTAIEKVAKRTIPAVVHVDVTQSQEVNNPLLPFQNDPFFRYFFNFPNMPRKFKRELKGLGTGMIMDPEGHILTNNHVVAGATKITVVLTDGEQYPAKVVGTDPKTDLAVIKISAKKPLPYVTFGDSDKVEVGEWVVAIGHPRGLYQTVTQGIISAKHRQGIMDPTNYQDYLQTDAAINPGNSGGPLLDLRGDVIGINAAIMSQSGGFEGIGFAIPSNMALYIAKQLIVHGKVERGWLGVSIQDVTPALAKSFGLASPKGALIADVAKGGPAEKAGIKRGDVVLAYQGKEIPDSGMLRNDVASTAIGEVVKVTIWRDGKEQTVRVKIGNLEDAAKMLIASVRERLGADVRPVTAKEVEKYGLGTSQGVAISSVDAQGPLGQAGFEVGDLILEIDGHSVADVESFAAMVNALEPRQVVTMLALDHRSGQTTNVQVKVR